MEKSAKGGAGVFRKLLNHIGRNPRWYSALGGGVGNAGFWDYGTYGESLDNYTDPSKLTPQRWKNLIQNFVLGAAGGAGMMHGIKKDNMFFQSLGPAALFGTVGKDLMSNANAKLPEVAEAVVEGSKSMSDSADVMKNMTGEVTDALYSATNASKANTAIAALLATGALGIGGMALWKYLHKKDPNATRAELIVPGKSDDPYSSLKVSMPIDDARISPALMEGMGRGIRAQARKNVKANTRKIDPATGKLIPYEEWEMKYGDEAALLNNSAEATEPTEQEESSWLPKLASGPIPPPAPAPAPQPQGPPPPPPSSPLKRPVLNPSQQPMRITTEGGNTSRLQASLNGAKAAINRLSGAGRQIVNRNNSFIPNVQPQNAAPGFSVKSASFESPERQEVRGIMKRIYDENPSYWPYGLNIEGHDSLYLVRDNMTKAAAGFVGWQEFREDMHKVGCYSIGILPEYRKNGFAKEAVAKIIREKAAGVDEVRAYVVHSNTPSKNLAKSLGIPVKEKF